MFIVGKGNHSAGGVQKLKPAIEQLAQEERLTCIPNKPNEGPHPPCWPLLTISLPSALTWTVIPCMHACVGCVSPCLFLPRKFLHARLSFAFWGAGCVYVILDGDGKIMGGLAAFFRSLAHAFKQLFHRS